MRQWLAGLVAFIGACSPTFVTPTNDGGVVDAKIGDDGAAAMACSSLSIDRSRENLDELNRIGLLLSFAQVEAHVGAPFPYETRYLAPIDITRVPFGPSFLIGTRAHIELSEAEAKALTLPGDYVIGFGGNPYPLKADDGTVVWWTYNTAVPMADAARLSDVIGYRADQVTAAYVVRIDSQDVDRTRFSIVETLDGTPRTNISTNWTKSIYAAPFPGVASTQYLASFADVSWLDSDGIYLGTVVDFRPDTPSERALVTSALAARTAPFDNTALRAAADRYKLSWTFHRVGAYDAKVIGLAGECCTNAGGTYVMYQYGGRDLGDPVDYFVLGGHGSESTDRCGDRVLLAIRGYDQMDRFDHASFSCDLATAQALPTGMKTVVALARLEGTKANLEQVGEWVESWEPVYRFYATRENPAAAIIGYAAPWSTPLSVADGFAAGALVRIEIEDVVEAAGRNVVTFSTTLSEYDLDHLQRYEAKLAFKCGDPRLLQKGSAWLVPIVGEAAATTYFDLENLFVVPGVMLPDLDYVHRIISQYQYRISH